MDAPPPALHQPSQALALERPARRVLLLTPRLMDSCGGRAATDLALALDRTRFEPVVCCYAGWGLLAAELEQAGIEIFMLRRRPGLDLLYMLALARQMRARRIDLVHSLHARKAYVVGVLAGLLAGVPAGIATFREEPELRSRWLARAGRLCGEAVGEVVATSEDVRELLLKERWVPPGKAIVIPDGVNLRRFHQPGQREAARAHWRVPPERALVGAVLQAPTAADVELLLAAFTVLRVELARRGHPDALLFICGLHGEGPGWRGLGPYADSTAFYAAVDAICIPHVRQVVPLELLEALAAGVPIAACRASDELAQAPAGPWAFADITAANPQALGKGLCELLCEREAARALVRGGAQCIHDGFTLEANVARIQELYSEALEL